MGGGTIRLSVSNSAENCGGVHFFRCGYFAFYRVDLKASTFIPPRQPQLCSTARNISYRYVKLFGHFNTFLLLLVLRVYCWMYVTELDCCLLLWYWWILILVVVGNTNNLHCMLTANILVCIKARECKLNLQNKYMASENILRKVQTTSLLHLGTPRNFIIPVMLLETS